MRRGVGITGLQRNAQAKANYTEVGQTLATEQLEQFKDLHGKFKENLEAFAKKYQKEISKNPVLRVHFQRMCTSIGVDPLASSKGFWAEILGIGDFYYELGVKIVEACMKLRDQTGGLVEIETLQRKLQAGAARGASEVQLDDIVKAVDTLRPLGSGFKVVEVGGRQMVQSVPREMSTDTTAVLDLAAQSGHFDEDVIRIRLGWGLERIGNTIDTLVSEGLVWIDAQSKPASYWVPGLFSGID